jgi:hypothetical protein
MARQIIRTAASRFETIQEGHQTCVILENDRLWSTYDELWFVECGKDGQSTGRVVRASVTFIQGGLDELRDALVLVSIRPLGRGLEVMPIETTTTDVLAAVMKDSYETLLMPGKPRQEMLY